MENIDTITNPLFFALVLCVFGIIFLTKAIWHTEHKLHTTIASLIIGLIGLSIRYILLISEKGSDTVRFWLETISVLFFAIACVEIYRLVKSVVTRDNKV